MNGPPTTDGNRRTTARALPRAAAQVAAFSVLAALAFTTPSAYAQAPAFGCTSGFYQVIGGQLTELDVAGGRYTPIGPQLDPYNAIAYRVADDYIYGVQDTWLIRIDAAGGIERIDDLGRGANTADFDEKGDLHISNGGSDWERIDLDTLERTSLPSFDADGIYDVAHISGQFYGVSSSGVLVVFDPVSGSVIEGGTVAGLMSGFYGAAWVANGGDLYVGRNSGEVYQVLDYNSGSPTARQVATAESTSQNDGASCPLAPPPPGVPIDTDDDGVPDHHDLDDDNDGILDTAEGLDRGGIEFVEGIVRNGDFNNGYIDSERQGTPYRLAQRDFAPAPWQRLRTADLSTSSRIAFSEQHLDRGSLSGFDTSPTGGSFMGYRGSEGIFQSVAIADPNEALTIRYDYTEYPAPGRDPAPESVNIEFRLRQGAFDTSSDGVLVERVSNFASSGGTNGTWESREVTFVPALFGIAAGTAHIAIAANNSDQYTWAFVDGFAVLTTKGDQCADTDGDTRCDRIDLDSDNDGIADIYEAGDEIGWQLDIDGDATISAADGFVDRDADGLDDRIELAFGADTGLTPVDSSDDVSDSLPDFLDLDSDDDGIPDATEARSTSDHVPYAPGPLSDADADGILDMYDTGASFGSAHSGFRTPSRRAHNHDGDADDDYRDADADNDGLRDADESDDPPIVGVSYADPDGNVNDPLTDAADSIELENADADPSEVDFRSLDQRVELEVRKTVVGAGQPCPGSFEDHRRGLDTLSARAGTTVTYCVHLRNTGRAAAHEVVARDELDALSPRSLGTIEPDRDVMYSFARRVPIATETASVFISGLDVHGRALDPIADDAGTTPPTPNLSVRLTVVPEDQSCPADHHAAAAGRDIIIVPAFATVVYCVNIVNRGPGDAQNVSVTDAIQGSRSFGSIAPGTERAYFFTHVTGATDETVEAVVTGNDGDGQSVRPDQDEAGTEMALPSIEIRVTARSASLPCPAVIAEGQDGYDVFDAANQNRAKYCYNVINHGPGDAHDVVVVDDLNPRSPISLGLIPAGSERSFDYLRHVAAGIETNLAIVSASTVTGESAGSDRDRAGISNDGLDDRDGDGALLDDPDPNDPCVPDPSYRFCDNDGDGHAVGDGDQDDDPCSPDPSHPACAAVAQTITRGDVNCDGKAGIDDAMMIAQYITGIRDAAECPLPDPATTLQVAGADYDLDRSVTIVDSLVLSQCVVAIANPACP